MYFCISVNKTIFDVTISIFLTNMKNDYSYVNVICRKRILTVMKTFFSHILKTQYPSHCIYPFTLTVVNGDDNMDPIQNALLL